MAANDELTHLRAENEELEEEKHHLSVSGSMEAALEARKAEAADLEKQLAAVDSEIDQARRRIAELEESAQAGGAQPPAD